MNRPELTSLREAAIAEYNAYLLTVALDADMTATWINLHVPADRPAAEAKLKAVLVNHLKGS